MEASLGVVDKGARDTERMWAREAELIKGLKPEQSFNCVPVGKVNAAIAEASGGGIASTPRHELL